ncbi:MAG: hypothetical protein IPH55_01395 [Betaproteobacteria bacterium]|nr:hypothetical protein [Betaproteobacteria bacterium]
MEAERGCFRSDEAVIGDLAGQFRSEEFLDDFQEGGLAVRAEPEPEEEHLLVGSPAQRVPHDALQVLRQLPPHRPVDR